MIFTLTMAWRDSRASRRRMVLYSLSVVLGIAGLVAVASLGVNLRDGLDYHAKGLLGADLSVSSYHPFSPNIRRYLENLGGEQAAQNNFGSMFSVPDAAVSPRIVQVKAIEGGFPFYGDFVTTPTSARAKLREGGDVVVVDASLLERFGLRIGDKAKLGAGTFTIIGTLEDFPGEAQIMSTVVPRAIIPFEAGPRAAPPKAKQTRERLNLKFSDDRDTDAIVRDMKEKFKDQNLSYETAAERKRAMGRALTDIDSFLTLAGFVALFLGGIGVSSSIHVYIRQKVGTAAILRCLGATALQSFSIYFIQGVAIGLMGALLGAALGIAVQFAIPHLVKDLVPVHLQAAIVWSAVGKASGAGLAICLLFTLAPLLSIRKISPLAAIRSTIAETELTKADPLRIALGFVIVVAVVAFCILHTRDYQIGLGFAGMLMAGFLILAGVAKTVAWAAQRWTPASLPYVVRQGIANLHRPNNRTVLILLSVGLGTFLLFALYLTRTSLLRQWEGPSKSTANMLFSNIDEDQWKDFSRIVTEQKGTIVESIPSIKVSIISVRGKPWSDFIAQPKFKTRGPLPAQFWTTYHSPEMATERVMRGTFPQRVSPGRAIIPISIDQNFLSPFTPQVGEEIVFDVSGIPVRTQVAAHYAAARQRFYGYFPIVFPEGAIEQAPKEFRCGAHAPSALVANEILKAVNNAYPSINGVDFRSLIEAVDRLFSKVARVIQFMALFTVATGVLMLASAVLAGRYQRLREIVLLRTLGATQQQILLIQMVEYAVLGLLAAVVGCSLGVVGNALMAHYIYKVTPTVPVLQVLSAMATAATVTTLTGMMTNRGIIAQPPLEVLRQET